MKKIYALLLFAALPFFASAQCSVVITGSTNVTCFGSCDGSATAVANGTPAFNYIWMPGNITGPTAQGLCAGTYTVTMIDGNACTATATVTITQPSQLQCASAVTQNPSCPSCCDGQAVGTAFGGTPGYTYMWTPGGNTTTFNQGMCNGSYTFCVVDMNGCMCCDTGMVVTGIHENAMETSAGVTPNPATNSIVVEANGISTGDYTIQVYDVLGNLVEMRNGKTQAGIREELNVSAYKPGIYFVEIHTATGTVTSKFVKQ